MSDVTLSAAVRSSLLSLQNTSQLIDRTQNRLSSGLRVSSAIDDPVSFFQAKTLSDRAITFSEKKDGIDQGVSTVVAALEGIEAIDSIVRQLKGIVSNMKSATGTNFTDLITQFNNLRTQIGTLADDATFQGVNLVNSTTDNLSVSFSDKTASLLSVDAVNLRESGLLIGTAGAGAATTFNYAILTSFDISAGVTITVTYQGSAQTLDLSQTNTIVLTYGTVDLTIQAGTNQDQAIAAGDIFTLSLFTSASSVATAGFDSAVVATFVGIDVTAINIIGNDTVYITEGDSNQITSVTTTLDNALKTLRSNAQTLGSNVALLQTRLDFTSVYVDVLETGAAKLTLADLNEEGANLLALQTRQQLGISALAFAGQAEQGILALFR